MKENIQLIFEKVAYSFGARKILHVLYKFCNTQIWYLLLCVLSYQIQVNFLLQKAP